MKKKIPIGVSDFKDIIEEDMYFVDKTLLIKELIEDGSRIVLLPRPRRFGKTLNMSMLKYFFEKTDEDKSGVFKHLNIWKHKECVEHYNKYPVIFITFKDLKAESWEDCYSGLKRIIANEYRRYNHLSKVDILDAFEKKEFKKICELEATKETYQVSFKNLTEYLAKYYGQKPIILIDEYDVPLQSGYVEGYYDEAVSFMRSFLGSALKDNIHLHKGVLTGILKVAKESIFSGLNNLNSCTILNYVYNDHFGFSEEEVFTMLDYYGIKENREDIKRWYNGYLFGENTVYNPWSVISFANKWREGLKPYWLNTSSNDLVKEILREGNEDIKIDMELLLKGNIIEKQIYEETVMADVQNNSGTIWSLLLFSGYLKVVEKVGEGRKIKYKLAIPNEEVYSLYEGLVRDWFTESISENKYKYMIKALTTGDIETFSDIFQIFILNSMSYFDVNGREPEKVYHAFVLGLLVTLNDRYEVISNGESGYGRYDVMLVPRDIQNLGIIFEFKKKRETEDLEICVQNALKQIEDKKYRQRLIDRGIKNIIDIGIAFDGKKVLIKERG